MAFFDLTPKKELVLRIICLFVIIFLCLIIYFHGQNLNCNKCEIHFESYVGEVKGQHQNFAVNISAIYDRFIELKEDKCLVIFKPREGYVYKQNFNLE